MRHALVMVAASLVLAPAATACPETSLGDLEDEVMCLECGTQLGIATESKQAARERAFIERLIAECKSKDEVKAALVAEYGDEVLALPADDGFEIAAYLIPLAILLGAGGAIAVGARRWRRRAGPGAVPGPAAADADRLDEDLARYDL